MTDSKHTDIRRSLEPEVEDDNAVMEGRLPALDAPEVTDAALAIMKGLEDLPEDMEDSVGHGQSAERTMRGTDRQPWLRMAAALMVGVLLTTLVNTRLQLADSGSSIASANVVYLESYRSAVTDLPVLEITDDPWVTLIAHPDYSEADSLEIYLERESDTGGDWSLILTKTVGIPADDAIVLAVESDLFTPGIFRLRIESLADGKQTGTSRLKFVVGR